VKIRRVKDILSPPGPQFDGEKGARFKRFINQVKYDFPILEIGGRGQGQDFRIFNLDIKPSPDVGIVGDGCELPVREDALGGVILTGVIEHVKNPMLLMDEIYRVLIPAGIVYIEAPFIQGFHPDPGDYQRFTLSGLEHLCNRFKRIESGICGGPASAVTWILQNFFSLLLSFGNDSLYRKWSFFWGWVLSPIRFLDAVLKRVPHAEVISSGFYFMGRKEDQQRKESG